MRRITLAEAVDVNAGEWIAVCEALTGKEEDGSPHDDGF